MQMIRVIALSFIFQITAAQRVPRTNVRQFGELPCGVYDGLYPYNPNYDRLKGGRELVAKFDYDRKYSTTLFFSFKDNAPDTTEQMYLYFALNNDTYLYLRANDYSKPDNTWTTGSEATFIQFDASKVIKVEYDATKLRYQFSQDGKIIGTKYFTFTSGDFDVGFRSSKKGQTMIVNPDASILENCAHEYKTLQDQVAQDAQTISALRQNRTRDQETIEAQNKTIDRCMSESEEDDVHSIKDGTCLQFQGAVIKERHVKAAIAKKIARIGAKLEDGSCASAGFTDRTWYKAPPKHCVSKSIWTK